MKFVVNEWLPEYLRPTASLKEREMGVNFLNALFQSNDKIVVRKPSAFLEKIHRFRKQFDYDLQARNNYKNLIKNILQNSDNCIFISDNDLNPLPENIQNVLKQEGTNYNSDTYLFEAANHTIDKIIITTDQRLIEAFSIQEEFDLRDASEFIQNYTQ